MKKCQFCESYRSHKNVHDFIRQHQEYYGEKSLLQYEICTAMVIKMWRPGYKRRASRETDYRSQGCGYQLNYCPECGKKLKER